MSTIQDLQTLCSGLQERLKIIRDQMALFNKAKGLLEEEEKLRADAERLKGSIKEQKEQLDDLQDKKNVAMMRAITPMATKMNSVLPYGNAILRIEDDGSLFIGWNLGSKVVPYAGLSGGEKAAFDPALCRALGGSILLVEAAELDDARLHEALEKYGKSDIQVLVSSCHAPGKAPEGWKVVSL